MLFRPLGNNRVIIVRCGSGCRAVSEMPAKGDTPRPFAVHRRGCCAFALPDQMHELHKTQQGRCRPEINSCFRSRVCGLALFTPGSQSVQATDPACTFLHIRVHPPGPGLTFLFTLLQFQFVRASGLYARQAIRAGHRPRTRVAVRSRPPSWPWPARLVRVHGRRDVQRTCDCMLHNE